MLDHHVETDRHDIVRRVSKGACGNEKDGTGLNETVDLGDWVGVETVIFGRLEGFCFVGFVLRRWFWGVILLFFGFALWRHREQVM